MNVGFVRCRRFGGSVISARSVAVVIAALLVGLPAGAAAGADQRGFVTEGVAGRLLFQRCDASGLAPQPMPLNDKTPGRGLGAGIDAVRQVRLDPDRPLYVEFRGEANASLVTALQFQRAIGHVASCTGAPASPAAGVRVLAEGRKPAWRLLATASTTRLEVAGAKPVEFAAASTLSAGGAAARSFTAKAGQGGTALRFELTEQPCSDNRSETSYGAQIMATVGERRLEGCAARF